MLSSYTFCFGGFVVEVVFVFFVVGSADGRGGGVGEGGEEAGVGGGVRGC